MSKFRFASLAALAALPLACTPASQPDAEAVPASGQTYAQAVAQMCDVDRQGALAGEGLELGRARSEWLKGHIESSKGIFLMTVLSVKPAKEQAESLAQEAQATGLSTCALSEALAKDELSALAP